MEVIWEFFVSFLQLFCSVCNYQREAKEMQGPCPWREAASLPEDSVSLGGQASRVIGHPGCPGLLRV